MWGACARNRTRAPLDRHAKDLDLDLDLYRPHWWPLGGSLPAITGRLYVCRVAVPEASGPPRVCALCLPWIGDVREAGRVIVWLPPRRGDGLYRAR